MLHWLFLILSKDLKYDYANVVVHQDEHLNTLYSDLDINVGNKQLPESLSVNGSVNLLYSVVLDI